MQNRVPFSKTQLLTIHDLLPAIFLKRLNRFVGIAYFKRNEEQIHVADPGRLTELLYPGNSILVKKAPEGTTRKTMWSLMAARGSEGWVLLNTFLHRRIAENILSRPDISPFGELKNFRAEVTPRGFQSRFDFLLEPKDSAPVWLEVKGCTLLKGKTALFPDAPTTRGTRHMRELAELAERGERAAVMFLVFPVGAECFAVNGDTDPDFHEAFGNAQDSGVGVFPLRLNFDGERVLYQRKLSVLRTH